MQKRTYNKRKESCDCNCNAKNEITELKNRILELEKIVATFSKSSRKPTTRFISNMETK